VSHYDEFVEVVGVDEKPTGEVVTLHEAHTKRLLHRVAAVLVFSEDGRLYVQVRNEPGFRRDHTAAGHVDPGESYEQAAMREMEEEIGLQVPIEFVASRVTENFSTTAHIFGVFKAVPPAEWGFKPNKEVKELLLMEVNDILNDMQSNPDTYTHGFRKTLEAYLNSKDERNE